MKTFLLPDSHSSVRCRKIALLSLSVTGVTLVCSQPLAHAAATTTTTMTLTSNGRPVTTVEPHTPITLTATVKAGSTVLKLGQVKFCDTTPSCQDIHLLGLSQLTAVGTATLKFVAGPGSHSYRAVFVGTNSDAPSASAASSVEVVSNEAYTSKTTIAAQGTEGSYTLSANIRGAGTTAAPTARCTSRTVAAHQLSLGKRNYRRR